tara:strand:+ start:5871 stop:6089 length:219 start_codon:yes stop_codon:yes gene_type:complete
MQKLEEEIKELNDLLDGIRVQIRDLQATAKDVSEQLGARMRSKDLLERFTAEELSHLNLVVGDDGTISQKTP